MVFSTGNFRHKVNMVEVDHCGTPDSEFKIGHLQNLVKCLDTTYM